MGLPGTLPWTLPLGAESGVEFFLVTEGPDRLLGRLQAVRPSASLAQAASAWAGAYDAYARTATADVMTPALDGQQMMRLRSKLQAAMVNTKAPDARLWARAWAEGIEAYWLTPAVDFDAGAALVTSFAGREELRSRLARDLTRISQQARPPLQAMAEAIDDATRTIVATTA